MDVRRLHVADRAGRSRRGDRPDLELGDTAAITRRRCDLERTTMERMPMTDLTKQIVERFLGEHGELLSVCTSMDVALLLRKTSGANTLIAGRVTAGCPLAPQTDQEFDFGDWVAQRFQLDASEFRSALDNAVNNQCLAFSGHPQMSFVDSLESWRSNDPTASHASIFGSRAFYTWIGAGTKRAFSIEEFNRFEKAIKRHQRFHDISTFADEVRFRIPMSPDHGGGVRFEIEIPVYYLGAEWKEDDAILRFDVRAPSSSSDVQLKWKSSESRNVSVLQSDGTGSIARITAPSGSVDITILFHSATWDFSEVRPVPKLSEFFPDSDGDELDLPDTPKLDFEQFGIKRQTLRRAIKRQVNRDQKAFNIIARDIEDAIACLSEKRYKIVAILAGGIVEGILISRLESEAREVIRNTYIATFSNRSPKSDVANLTLQELVAVAAKLGKLKDEKLYDTLRDWRNFVHFHAEKRDDAVDVNSAQIAIRAAIRLLLEKN